MNQAELEALRAVIDYLWSIEEADYSDQDSEGRENHIYRDLVILDHYQKQGCVVIHADYPHEPGRLYDCPRCEAECFCTPGHTQCVFCAILEEETR